MQKNKHFFIEKSKVICLFTLHNDLLGSIQHPEKNQIKKCTFSLIKYSIFILLPNSDI